MQFLREIVTVIYSVNFVGFCVHSSHGFIAWAFLDQGYALILVHHCGKCLNSSVKWSWTLIFLDYFSLSRLSFTQWVYWGPTEIPRILKTLYFYTGIFLLIQPCSMLKIIFIVIRSFDAKEFESNYWIRNAIILHLHLIRQVNIYI